MNIITPVLQLFRPRHPAFDVIQARQNRRHVITTWFQWDIKFGVISIAKVINIVFADYPTQCGTKQMENSKEPKMES